MVIATPGISADPSLQGRIRKRRFRVIVHSRHQQRPRIGKQETGIQAFGRMALHIVHLSMQSSVEPGTETQLTGELAYGSNPDIEETQAPGFSANLRTQF
jgi:hypothetical protein